MGDAITEGYTMANQAKIVEQFHEALIKYLRAPFVKNKEILQEKTLLYEQEFGEKEVENLRSFIKQLEENNHVAWKKLQTDAFPLFRINERYKEMFLEAAEQRKIGSAQRVWVV